LGVIFSIIAGVCMSIQGVFNTRLGDKIGIWETNITVQATGLVLTFLILLSFGDGHLKDIRTCNKLYLLGGVLGVIIIFTVMKGIKELGTTYSIATILVAQLATAAFIDAVGLFDTVKVPFGINKYIGVAIMVVGIVIFKWKR
jgi:transporter family-2 protein